MQLNQSSEINKPIIENLDIDITNICNVNCAGCNHYSALTTKAWYYDVDVFNKDLNRVNSLFEVNAITLTGGEPLLHPKLEKLIDILLTIFNKNTRITVFHNGTLINKFNDLIKKYSNYPQMTFHCSVYPTSENKGTGNCKINKTKYRDRSEMSYLNLRLDESGDFNISNPTCMCAASINSVALDDSGNLYSCALFRNMYLLKNYFNLDVDLNKYRVNMYATDNAEAILNTIINIKREHSCKVCAGRGNREMHSWHRSNKNIKEWVDILPDGTKA